jgi:hypothetical protein
MKTTNVLLTMLCGALVGVVSVLSCGDNGPMKADASVACDCPLAEPPIATRVMEVVDTQTTLPPANMAPYFGRRSGSVLCPMGAIVLSGGCAAGEGQAPDIVLEQSFPGGRGWACEWRNNTNNSVPVRAIVRCLVPAQ